MAINIITKTVNTDYERTLDGKQIVTQCNFDTQSRGGVSKLCALTGDVQIIKAQALSKQLKISGRLALKLVYLDSDRQLKNFDYISDFAEDLNDDCIVADMPCIVNAHIVDIQSGVSGNEIKVQTVIELTPAVVEISTNEVVADAEGALTLKEPACYQKYLGTVDEEFSLSEEYATGVKVDDVLLYDAKAIVLGVDNNSDKLEVSGQAEICLVYSAEGSVSTKNISIPFVQQTAVTGENLTACVNAKIKDSKLVIEGDEKDNVFKAYVTVALSGFVMQSQEEDSVTDLYSPCNKLDVSQIQTSFLKQTGVKKYEERISGSVAVEEGESIQSIVSAVVTQNTLSSLVAMDDELLAEGVANTSVIYKNADGENKCIQIELPYSLQFPSQGTCKDDILSGNAIATDCTYKKKRDKEVEITLAILVSVCSRRKITAQAVSGAEEGEALERNDSAVSIYLPDKGETIWQIAKTLGSSIEKIKEQNPDLTNEMQGDERIVIYREIG